MSFEDKMIAGIDKRRQDQRKVNEKALQNGPELPSEIKKAHERMKKEIFSNPEYAVQAPEFFDVYTKELVVADMQEVLALRKKFEANENPDSRRAKILSEVFEGLVLVGARDGKWFGGANFLKTSSYDDLKNKTDMYGEWFTPEEGSRVLALAVDLTFSSEGGENKLQQIKREIDAGHMREIRYFKDARGDYKGTRYNVPRIVLGVGTRELADLSRIWMGNKHEQYANHHVRTILITEMYDQVKTMLAYAEKIGQKDIARAYRQASTAVEPLYNGLKNRPALGEYKDDPVLKRIQAGVKVLS